MFELSFGKLILIFGVALLVLGPQKTTEMARLAGFWIARIKNHLNNIKENVSIEKNFGQTINDVKKELQVFRAIEHEIKDDLSELNQQYHENQHVYECETLLYNDIKIMPKKKKMKASMQRSVRLGALKRNKLNKKIKVS